MTCPRETLRRGVHIARDLTAFSVPANGRDNARVGDFFFFSLELFSVGG